MDSTAAKGGQVSGVASHAPCWFLAPSWRDNGFTLMPDFKKLRAMPHWAIIVLLLAGILGLQLAISFHKFTIPFLDGRLHYNFDNSLFLFFARNGIRLNTPRAQLGITYVSYSTWGIPQGEVIYYANHPFLFKGLFQLYVRIFGDAEWVSRSFALGVASIASAGIFTGLLVASEDVIAAFLGTVVLVGLPVFAIFQSCIRYEIDGMAAGSWCFAAVALYLNGGQAGYGWALRLSMPSAAVGSARMMW